MPGLPSRQRTRLTPRAGPDRDRYYPAARSDPDIAGRSFRGNAADESPGPCGDQGWNGDFRTAPERGHILRATDRHGGAPGVAQQGAASRVHSADGIADAVVPG